MSGWQPIETAPRDGTAVLLFEQLSPGAHPQVHPGNRIGESLCIGVGRWISPDYDPDGWMDAFDYTPLMESPSHWMPLPAPPEPQP